MTKRFELRLCSNGTYYVYENGTLTDIDFDKFNKESADALVEEVNTLYDENEQLKKELKRCRDWLNSDKNDYQLTLAFIKSKGYSLKDVLEYEKELSK